MVGGNSSVVNYGTPSSATPSPISLPCSPGNEKSRRYDRQLRLWGDHGQVLIEGSQVCLINASATNTEILKSLVLPGIGSFTIVDGTQVRGEDIGNNFFLHYDSIGQSRGVVATRLLLELNPEVRGDCVEETPEQILENNPSFFSSNFNLVIATDITEETRLKLSKIFWESNIPFMHVRTYGFLSYIRLQVKEHTIVESHPDNLLDDLRIDNPFPALKSFLDSQDLSKMDRKKHMHTPYVVLLYQTLMEWRTTQGSQYPKNYKEKKIFKEMMAKGKLSKEDDPDIPEDEENFDEAMKAVNTALQPTKLSDSIQEILNDDKCTNLNSSSKDFWIMARGIKDFVDNEGNGRLPVRGVIPDMFSDTERYVALQNIYKNKADIDAEIVLKYVQHHLETIGRNAESISESNVKSVCKNAANLRVVRGGNPMYEEYRGSKLNQILEVDPDSDAVYYLILLGIDRFYSEYSAYPGALNEDQVETDISKLKNSVSKVINDYAISNPSVIKDENIHEMTRYGAAEPHAMAAFIGGCAAQEAIKLLTRQYVPINNLFIYNAMTSITSTIQV